MAFDLSYIPGVVAKLARAGGRSSVARNAPDIVAAYKEQLEAADVPFTLTFHPRPGWQFIVDKPEDRKP